MAITPPEFAVAGLEPSVQLYQLTMQMKRLRAAVQRAWLWIGAIALFVGVPAIYNRWIRPPALVGSSLVLAGSSAKIYTVVPKDGGLGIQVSDRNDAVLADLLVKTEGQEVSVEKDGKVLWRTP
jgi:hypothetical protein